MPTPTTPIINKPHNTGVATSVEYSTNIRLQTITGTADSLTVRVLQNGISSGMEFNPLSETEDVDGLAPGQWRLTLPSNPSLVPGENIFIIQAEGADGSLSIGADLRIILVEDGSLGFLVGAPTGISLNRFTNRIEFILTHSEDVLGTTPDSLIVGFNYYAAVDAGGGLVGYTLLNTALVNDFKEIKEELLEETETIDRTVDPDDSDLITIVTTTTAEVQRVYKYSFNHVRSNGPDATVYPQRTEAQDLFSSLPDNQEVFYVASALAFDEGQAIEYESTFTSELTGLPLILSTRIKDLTPRTLSDVQTDLITEILRVQSTIDVKPGSVTRDVHIDPPAFEANKLWLIADFISRAQSFLTLIQLDDPTKSGTSLPVQESQYKIALGRAMNLSDAEVQTLIDESFEKLAGNSLTIRRGATFSQGQVIFQRSTAPTQDLTVLAGTTVSSRADSVAGIRAVTFVTTSTKTMTISNIASFFNAVTGFYELTVTIQATAAGALGNVAAGSIISSNAAGFSTATNREATLFGQDQESNLSLAERAMLSFVSVDTGTAGGYLRTALDVNGVHRARIVEAGEELMMRDWDPAREKHIGGKVDVWIQGTAEIEVSQIFAFKYLQDLNVRFTLVGDASNLIFRTTSANVTIEAPIFAMLNDPGLGLGFRNSSTGEDFDLTNVTILDFNLIQLDIGQPQPSVSVDDIIIGDYKFRDSGPFIPTLQPIRSISSIASTGSTLTTDNFQLIRVEDPLLLGFSVEANDQINIVQANGLPSGDPITVVDEPKVLVASFAVELDNVGVDVTTIVVTNLSSTITYDSDLTANPTPDFFIVAGSLTEPATIARNTAGTIVNGQQVLVSYTAEENFTATYSINNVLQLVNTDVQVQRHVTADVLVKQSIENEVTLAATVVLKENADQADVDIEIRTNLSNLVNRLQVGQDLHQSDIVAEIERVDAVEYVILPLTLLHKSDGSLILRDRLDNDSTRVVEGIDADVYLINQSLTFPTTEGGGPTNLHRGIFKNEQPVTLFGLYTDFNELEDNPNSGLIVGNDGIEIFGFSDVNTKVALTANRILVSLPKDETPEDHIWDVSYIVGGETGKGDIEAFVMEYLVLGETTLTYTSDLDEFGNDF